jgi:hypothetical protein
LQIFAKEKGRVESKEKEARQRATDRRTLKISQTKNVACCYKAN